MPMLTIDVHALPGIHSRARRKLTPPPNMTRGNWPHEEAMLDDLARAVRLAQSSQLFGQWVGLTVQEAQMLHPFLED